MSPLNELVPARPARAALSIVPPPNPVPAKPRVTRPAVDSGPGKLIFWTIIISVTVTSLVLLLLAMTQ